MTDTSSKAKASMAGALCYLAYKVTQNPALASSLPSTRGAPNPPVVVSQFEVRETDDEVCHIYKDGDAAWEARLKYAEAWCLTSFNGYQNCWCLSKEN